MKGPVPKEELGTVLLHAMCAAKIIRDQHDRLLQFQLQLQPGEGEGEGDPPVRLSTEDIGSSIVRASIPIRDCTKSLGACLEIASTNGVRPSHAHALAGALGEQVLFDRLLALRLSRRPATQAHAFARVEAAVYAIYTVMLNIHRCVELLSFIVDPAPAATSENPLGTVATATNPQEVIGPPDTVAAATEHLAKIGLSDQDDVAASKPTQDSSKIGLPSPAPATEPQEDIGKTGLPDPVAAATEHLAKIGLLDQDDVAATKPTLPSPAPAVSATGEPLPQETSGSMYLNQARTCLDRACTLSSLAVKHIELAVAAMSSCLDPEEVARISDCAGIVAIA